jgi:hypothetical protein
MEIIKLLNKVMEDVGAVEKKSRNTSQNFNFRGIDAVVNATSPAFRTHGVVCIPTLNDIAYETVEVGQNRSRMASVRVNVTYTFHAPDGSSVAATVAAESMDSGDKATAKAMSVAFRTALLQTLCLPTDDIDPDHHTYERSAAEPEKSEMPIKSDPVIASGSTKKAGLGSASQTSKPAPKPQAKPAQQPSDGKRELSEAQLKFITDLCKQVGADGSLVKDLTGDDAEHLSSEQAKKLIEDLLAVKRGQASLVADEDGMTIVRD